MTGPVEVRRLQASDDDRLSAFLDRVGAVNPSVLGYHYPFYRDMLERIGIGDPHYLGAWTGDELVAFLPGFLRKAPLGTCYCSLPFFGPNAGVIEDTDDRHPGAAAALIDAVSQQLATLPDAISAAFYTNFLPTESEREQALFEGALRVPKFTQFLPIADGTWPGVLRRNLRKAVAAGVRIERHLDEERITRICAIYHQNCNAYGIPPKPAEAVRFLLTEGHRLGFVRCHTALLEGQVVSALVTLWSPLTVSYYIPCTTPEARSTQAGVALIDRVYREAAAEGRRYWNWESSPDRESGVYRFKKKWGSKESDYSIYVRPFRPERFFRDVGRDQLSREFPYYFVYPYGRL